MKADSNPSRPLITRILAGLVLALSLCACGVPVHKEITPEVQAQMMKDLREGQLMLVSGNMNANFYFIDTWRQMAQAYNARQWERLAVLVMNAGHECDLAYYFLGASAEQLGYLNAAAIYYNRAVALYIDPVYAHHCRELLSFGGCPIDLSRAIPVRQANVRRLLQIQAQAAQPAPQPVAPKPGPKPVHHPTAPKTQPAPENPNQDLGQESSPMEQIVIPPKTEANTPGQSSLKVSVPPVEPLPAPVAAKPEDKGPVVDPGQKAVKITVPPVDQQLAPPGPKPEETKPAGKKPDDDYSY